MDVDERGVPVRVRVRGRWQSVETVLDAWRIDDEWWRQPIARAYFSLALESGAHLTVYHDLVENRWYIQPQ